MANNKLIQLLRGGADYVPNQSEERLKDGQPFYSKREKTLYIGEDDKQLKDLQPLYASNLQNGSMTAEHELQSNLKIRDNATSFDRNSGTYLTQGGKNVRPHATNGKYIESYPVGSDNINSLALGTESYAHGENSTTLGKKNYAGHNQTVAAGQGTRAMDRYSAAFCEGNIAGARSTFVVGADNTALGAMTLIGGRNNMSGGYASIIHGMDNTEGYYLYDTQTNKLYLTTKKLADTMTLETTKDVELTTSGVLNSTTGLTYSGKVYTLGRDEENNPRILINGTEAGIYIMSNNQRYIAFGDNSNSDSNILPKYNIISGRSNKISMQSIQNILSGTGNTISKCNSSIISGANNTVLGGNYLAVLGVNNIARGNASILMGDNNEIPLDGSNNPYLRCALFGTYLQAGASNQTIVGKYNAPSASALFQVGIGTSESGRKNALSVLSSGAVTIPKVPTSGYEPIRYSDIVPTDGRVSTSNGFNVKFNSVLANNVKSENGLRSSTLYCNQLTAISHEENQSFDFVSNLGIAKYSFDKPIECSQIIGKADQAEYALIANAYRISAIETKEFTDEFNDINAEIGRISSELSDLSNLSSQVDSLSNDVSMIRDDYAPKTDSGLSVLYGTIDYNTGTLTIYV